MACSICITELGRISPEHTVACWIREEALRSQNLFQLPGYWAKNVSVVTLDGGVSSALHWQRKVLVYVPTFVFTEHGVTAQMAVCFLMPIRVAVHRAEDFMALFVSLFGLCCLPEEPCFLITPWNMASKRWPRKHEMPYEVSRVEEAGICLFSLFFASWGNRYPWSLWTARSTGCQLEWSFLKHGTGSGSPIRMFYCKYKHGCLFDRFHIHGMIYAMISNVNQPPSLGNRSQNAILKWHSGDTE